MRFAQTLNGLGKVRQEVLDVVIVEFLEALTAGPDVAGGAKAARKLLGAVLDDGEVTRLLDGGQGAAAQRLGPAERHAGRRAGELPVGRASADRRGRSLSELRPETAASVLERLDRGFAQSIVLRLSRVPSLDPAVASAIHGAIERDFLSVLQRNLSKRRPADLIAGLMNNISSEARDGFLGYLEAQEPGLAQDVQRTMFTFEDIPARLNPRDIAAVLRDVPEETLLLALKLGEAPGQRHGRLRARERAAPAVRALRRGPRRAARARAQGRRGGADRDHQGDPGAGARGADPLRRKGRRGSLRRRRRRSGRPVRGGATACQRGALDG